MWLIKNELNEFIKSYDCLTMSWMNCIGATNASNVVEGEGRGWGRI